MPPSPTTLINNKRDASRAHLAESFEAAVRESAFTSELLSYPNNTAKKEASTSTIRMNRILLRAIGASLGVGWTTNWTTTRTNIVTAINALTL